jgi:hypothetical protein
MAAQCVSDLETAVKAVEADYGKDPKWKAVIDEANKLVTDAKALEGPMEQSPGQKAATEAQKEAQEDPKEEATETPAQEKAEDTEEPKDMKGAAKVALLMLRKK